MTGRTGSDKAKTVLNRQNDKRISQKSGCMPSILYLCEHVRLELICGCDHSKFANDGTCRQNNDRPLSNVVVDDYDISENVEERLGRMSRVQVA